MDDRKIADRIAALLAKAESSKFEEEADAFFAKAQELMLKYAIDDEMLRASEGKARHEVGREDIGVKDRDEVASARRCLLNTIARANRCRVVVLSGKGKCALIGTEPDREFVKMLYASVMAQHHGLRLKAWRNYPKMPALADKGRHLFVVNFADAFATRVGYRITANATLNETKVAPTGSGLMLLRDADVNDFMSREFGRLRSARTSHHRVVGAARELGRAAAGNVDISGGRGHVAGQRSIGR